MYETVDEGVLAQAEAADQAQAGSPRRQ